MMKLKINKDKSIGSVFYLVEGDDTEPKLIKHIFNDLLGYQTISYDKRSGEFTESKYRNKNIKCSRVFVVTLPKPQIGCISESKNYLEPLITKLEHKYYSSFSDSAVFFLFDRDRESNKPKKIEPYINTYGNSRDNKNVKAGLFLLSYPSIEAFILNAYNDKKTLHDGPDAKKYIKNNHKEIARINCDGLMSATSYLISLIEGITKKNFDFSCLDDFSEVSKILFMMEERSFKQSKIYIALSLLAISLLDLGIITEK